MLNLTKKQKRLAKELLSKAYGRELDYHLEELAKKFDAWREHKIAGWELSDLIHEHHDGISRELFKIYNYFPCIIFPIARAVKLRFLKKDEIPNELSECVNKTLEIIPL